jgi:anthranilate phosphoribosyltransferase
VFKSLIHKVVGGSDLSEGEMVDAMEVIMGGEATHAQVAAFLTALRMKGETVDEITGAARVMRDTPPGSPSSRGPRSRWIGKPNVSADRSSTRAAPAGTHCFQHLDDDRFRAGDAGVNWPNTTTGPSPVVAAAPACSRPWVNVEVSPATVRSASRRSGSVSLCARSIRP